MATGTVNHLDREMAVSEAVALGDLVDWVTKAKDLIDEILMCAQPAASAPASSPARSACAGGLPIGRIVLASLAGHAVGRDEVACDQPRIQPIAAQLACPVMRTAAGLQGHQAAGRQLRAPGRKLVSGQRLGNHHARIHRMHLDNPLSQIHPDSRNLVHGLPLHMATD